MKKLSNFIYKIFPIFLVLFSIEVKSQIIGLGNQDSKVTVKVFSSLTCPACANFHSKIFYKLKQEYIDKGLVRFEHHPFPLDLAALNAEIILRCSIDNNKNFKLLGKIYENQRNWAVGSDIIKINESIKKITAELNYDNKKIDTCLKNEEIQDQILSLRIEAQKKYKIEATPTIFINEKKYSGKSDYKEFKKELEKKL